MLLIAFVDYARCNDGAEIEDVNLSNPSLILHNV